MSRLGVFLLGVVSTLLVLTAGAFAAVFLGLLPTNADASPGALERWAAAISLRATIAREAPKGDAPIPADAKNLNTGLDIYANNCAVCHGYADAKRSSVAEGLYQKPPQFARRRGGRGASAGETYWAIEHGIRLTGMPAFNGTLTEEQVWQVTIFLKHMNELPAAVGARWKALHPTLTGVAPAT